MEIHIDGYSQPDGIQFYSHFCRFWYDSTSVCIFLYNAALFLSILIELLRAFFRNFGFYRAVVSPVVNNFGEIRQNACEMVMGRKLDDTKWCCHLVLIVLFSSTATKQLCEMFTYVSPFSSLINKI